jgi:hypothetical protein
MITDLIYDQLIPVKTNKIAVIHWKLWVKNVSESKFFIEFPSRFTKGYPNRFKLNPDPICYGLLSRLESSIV